MAQAPYYLWPARFYNILPHDLIQCTIKKKGMENEYISYRFCLKHNSEKNLARYDQRCVLFSVEIPTRCSFVIEFIIPKFIEGSTCFERHTAHHQEL